MKKIIFFIAIIICTVLSLYMEGQITYAKEGRIQGILKQKTKIDLDHDGDKEVLKIYNWDKYNGQAYADQISGKIVFSIDDKKFSIKQKGEESRASYTVSVIFMPNGKTILEFHVGLESDLCEMTVLAQYQDGEVKILKKIVERRYGGNVYKVTGNKIYYRSFQQFAQTGNIGYIEEYTIKGDKVIRSKRNFIESDSQKKLRTAKKDFIVYTKPGGNQKAVTVKKNQKVRVVQGQISVNKEKMYLQLKVVSTGKKGWFQVDYGQNEKNQLFKGVYYAG